MGKIQYGLVWMLRLAVGVVVSFLLFTFVSVLHSAFGLESKADKAANARPIASTVDMKKPPPEKKVAQRMRQVQQSNSEGKGSTGQQNMRFTPDLAVDASASGGEGVALENKELTAEVFEQGQTDEAAVALYLAPVQYPDAAREQNLQGDVVVEFIVNHEGKTTDIQVVKTPSPIFTAEVKRTIATWRFKPAKNKGIPVNVRYRQVIEMKSVQ